MVWGVLAKQDSVAIISVEISVRFKLVCFWDVRHFKFACILVYYGNGKCIVVHPFDEINTPYLVLC